MAVSPAIHMNDHVTKFFSKLTGIWSEADMEHQIFFIVHCTYDQRTQSSWSERGPRILNPSSISENVLLESTEDLSPLPSHVA